MQEGEVTIAGQHRKLARPFHVLATQNPIEQEGTYPLPEAQLDRFLLQIDIDYPSRDEEREILLTTTGVEEARAQAVLDTERLIALQRLVRQVPVGERVVEAILTRVRAARPDGPEGAAAARERLAWGPGPRAAQALILAARARALLAGRLSPSVADVAALARPALTHRMALTFAARAEGATIAGVIDDLLKGTALEEAA
ncbi:MAG TPA: MoxR family ATPase, partial [Thermohalobaculum sp.]|nr:MoxR family ATPase [Thermohalobaculum sp.]